MKKNISVIFMAMLLAFTLGACGSNVPEEPKEIVKEVKLEPDPLDSLGDAEKTEPESESDVHATVKMCFAYENGYPDLVETLDIPGVTDGPDETGHIINGYDDGGTLVYKREDSSFDDDKGIQNVTIVYEFYSLDHDFDLFVEPLQPENGGNIQTLTGSITYVEGGAKQEKSLSFEENGIRGQTGIWYAGICSCRNGKIVDFVPF